MPTGSHREQNSAGVSSPNWAAWPPASDSAQQPYWAFLHGGVRAAAFSRKINKQTHQWAAFFFSFLFFPSSVPNKCCNKNFSVAICKKKKSAVEAGLQHDASSRSSAQRSTAQVPLLNIYVHKIPFLKCFIHLLPALIMISRGDAERSHCALSPSSKLACLQTNGTHHGVLRETHTHTHTRVCAADCTMAGDERREEAHSNQLNVSQCALRNSKGMKCVIYQSIKTHSHSHLTPKLISCSLTHSHRGLQRLIPLLWSVPLAPWKVLAPLFRYRLLL